MRHSRVHEDRSTKPSTVTLDDISEGTHTTKDVTVDDGSPSANSSNLSKESSTPDDTPGGASWLSVDSQLRNKLKATEANLKQAHDACSEEDWHGHVGDQNDKVDAAVKAAMDMDLHPNPFNTHKLEGHPKDEPWQIPDQLSNPIRPDLLRCIGQSLSFLFKTDMEDMSLADTACL